jgi:opacity protein-like surface antigen
MLRGLIAALAAVAMFAVVPVATAAEPVKPDFDGVIELSGTNGYRVFGLVASFNGIGQVSLFVGKAGEEAIYTARGEGTANGLDVDFGSLGKVDVELRPTGKNETLHSKCGGKGKAVTIPANELVGTIEFHGEEGFTEFAATRTPLQIRPLLNIVCGGMFSVGTTSGSHVGGVQLKAGTAGNPSLLIQQNHLGARVFYEAKMHEKEGRVQVSRTVTGRLGAGAIRYLPSLESASFTAASPFSGRATYAGRTPPREARPGTGTWRGSLKVDFPGHAGVPIAGPGFKASIIHARRTESR